MSGTERFSRGAAQRLVVVIAAALIVMLVSACGGSSTSRSRVDPAAIVPASVPLYISLDVPTDSQVSQFHQLVTEFAGAEPWTKISRAFNAVLAKKKINWKQDVEPWIGNQVGVAIMNLSTLSSSTGDGDKGLVLILPTNNIKAALAFSQKNHGKGAVAERDGSDMVISDASTLAQFNAAQAGAKLSSSSGYTAVQKSLSGDNIVAYGAVHAIAEKILSSTTRAHNAAVTTTATKSVARIPADATVGVGVGVSKQSARIDVVSHDLPHNYAGASGGAGTVAGLPASSILATALNIGLPKHGTLVKELTAGFSQDVPSGLPGAGQLKHVESIVDTVLPALGPLTLSFGGNSLVNLRADLTLTPSSSTAGDKLLALLFNELKSKPALQVQGTAQNFSLGAGPLNVKVTDRAGRVLALLGSANGLLHSTTLASNATFKRGVSQLPVGAKVPFYLSFTGLNTLLGALPTTGVERARKVLGKLSYLIVGSAPGDFRIVLGLG